MRATRFVLRSAPLRPRTLSSGPESGLCNQLFALIGYVMMAHEQNRSLVLPPFTSHDANGTDVPFDALFEVEPLGASLKSVGGPTVIVRNSSIDAALMNWLKHLGGRSRRTLVPPSLAGWEYFKSFSYQRLKLPCAHKDARTSSSHTGRGCLRRERHRLQHLEDAVYRGLTPSRGIRNRVSHVKAALGLQSPASSYACLHARIESDMLASWPVVMGGRPPTLSQYLSGIEAMAGLRHVQNIFVAVGSAVSAADAARLDATKTSWGAKLVRSASILGSSGKPWHRATRRTGAVLERAHAVGRVSQAIATKSSTYHDGGYTASSLVDFMVCRQADEFIGWSASTFARMLARYQKYDHERGWYSACPEGLSHVDAHSDDLFRLWAMCRPENGSWISLPGERPGARKHNARGICSFGWCDQTAMLMLRSRRAVVEHRPHRR